MPSAETHQPSLAEAHPQHRLIGVALWLSMVFLVIGLFAPMMTLRKLLFFKHEVSIYTGLLGLFEEGHLGLFVLILVFSICFPIAKLLLLAYVWYSEAWAEGARVRLLHRLELLGRWSMLDVFVVALLVVTVKLGVMAEVQVHYGLYIFAAAVLGSMVVSWWMGKVAQQEQTSLTEPEASTPA